MQIYRDVRDEEMNSRRGKWNMALYRAVSCWRIRVVRVEGRSLK